MKFGRFAIWICFENFDAGGVNSQSTPHRKLIYLWPYITAHDKVQSIRRGWMDGTFISIHVCPDIPFVFVLRRQGKWTILLKNLKCSSEFYWQPIGFSLKKIQEKLNFQMFLFWENICIYSHSYIIHSFSVNDIDIEIRSSLSTKYYKDKKNNIARHWW